MKLHRQDMFTPYILGQIQGLVMIMSQCPGVNRVLYACLRGSLVSGVRLLHVFQDCSDKGLRRPAKIQSLKRSPKILADFDFIVI